MKKLLCSITLIIAGCGINGTQKLQTNDSMQRVVQSGESHTYVIFRLEFIDQIIQLCKDSFDINDINYNKEVSDCTFKNLSLININPAVANTFVNDYCKDGADLSAFTTEQIDQINLACGGLK